MRILLFIACTVLLSSSSIAQLKRDNLFKTEFNAAYEAFPVIPRGILEGVAYAQTRIRHINGNHQSCTGIPQVKGVMGLTEDGKGYFKNNLNYISSISRFGVSQIKESPAINIMAYAAAYNFVATQTTGDLALFSTHDQIMKTLSEIPWGDNAGADFALSCFTYEVFQFLMNPDFQEQFDFPNYTIDLEAIYGAENYAVLSSPFIKLEENRVHNENVEFSSSDRSAEYGPAIWNAAPSCNYSSRSGTAISAVTVHTIQGTYAGAIAWSRNCASNVSYHYVARSSDGQITQMVIEANKAWHVGSANPYTIGIEHEGYVDDPVWYTEAMYVSSADLVKDITESGYGINPLRTYKGVATAGTLTLGGCTKIKGHQHFPGASHTDPGINWDWEHYYQLINNEPEIVVNTSETGTSYDSGGAGGSYSNDERELLLIQPTGATSITLEVVSFDLEEDWDFLYVYDGDDLSAPLLGTYTGTTIPDVITSSGGSILIEFRSDCATTNAGWQINWSSVIGTGVGDEIPPTTTVEIDGEWQTENFTANFEDLDEVDGSGVRFSLMQVIDYNGTEWRANNDYGFFSDNFDAAIHPDWTTVTGDWEIASETLQQTNETLNNTNIYANVNQNEFDTYFYHWGGKISGTDTNKRMGLHFMCDNPTLTNRGNSYFVWFREDHNRVQVYKVQDNVYDLVAFETKSIESDVWYDFKTLYDKNSGEIHVWVNNELAISWTDSEPILLGNSVSFRTGHARCELNNLKIYHNRSSSEEIAIGPTGAARYQNIDAYTPAAKVKSIAIDSALNVSNIVQELVNIDWTAPAAPSFVNDGSGADIETTTTNTEIVANWDTTYDSNSDIARYWYSIGTSPEATDVVGWTDNWYADSVVHTGLSLTVGETYYVSVYAENGAGLFSEVITSNGQLLIEPTDPPSANFTVTDTELCIADSITFENASTDAISYQWIMPEASPSYSTLTNPTVFYETSGEYEVKLIASGPGGENDTIIETVSVVISAPPVANFEPSSDTVDIADALILFDNLSINSESYYWEFGDGSTSTDEEPYHTYDAVGVYTVSLLAINGDCPNNSTTRTVVVDDFAQLDNENGLTTLKVYPNPATSFIQITFNENHSQVLNYEIRDVRGRLIKKSAAKMANDFLRIELDGIEKGCYFIHLIEKNDIHTAPFVIE